MPRGADTGEAQASLHLAMPFALERADGGNGSDPLDQRCVRHRPCRSAPPQGLCRLRSAVAVEGGSRGAPDPAHPSDTVRLAAARGGRPAHRLDLRWTKGARRPGWRSLLPAARARAASRPAWLSAGRSRVLLPPQAGSPSWPHQPTGRCRASRSVSQPSRPGCARASPGPRPAAAGAPRRARHCRDIRLPRPGPTAFTIVVVSVVIVRLYRGQRPLMKCLTQLWGAGLGKTVRHRTSAYLNNRLEQDHRGIKGRIQCLHAVKDHDTASRSVASIVNFGITSASDAVTTRPFLLPSAAPADRVPPRGGTRSLLSRSPARRSCATRSRSWSAASRHYGPGTGTPAPRRPVRLGSRSLRRRPHSSRRQPLRSLPLQGKRQSRPERPAPRGEAELSIQEMPSHQGSPSWSRPRWTRKRRRPSRTWRLISERDSAPRLFFPASTTGGCRRPSSLLSIRGTAQEALVVADGNDPYRLILVRADHVQTLESGDEALDLCPFPLPG